MSEDFLLGVGTTKTFSDLLCALLLQRISWNSLPTD